eukprot:TRINITY_DN1081_c0_g2_i3.p1 TRINITY_DN1081_c0_g2~~TRINITY_DN1081_c0_g2_i3.p1  ORF type:complete len:295 (+),score=55.87 TRINITY_DN1081_c0_g2_i3:43-927(+)
MSTDQHFSTSLRGQTFSISLSHLNLRLRTSFGTSHSVSTSRTNALIEVEVGGIKGRGEVGLPPKKPLCYTANLADVEEFFRAYLQQLKDDLRDVASETQLVSSYDPFSTLPSEYFKSLRPPHADEDIRVQIVRFMFSSLDRHPMTAKKADFPFCLTAQCGVECALMDLWGKLLELPLYQLIGVSSDQEKPDSVGIPTNRPGFYTAGIFPDVAQVIETAQFGRQSTPFLKIKLDGNITNGKNVLETLQRTFEREDLRKKWSIDANTAWTPEIALQFAEQVFSPELQQKIFMVEQP